MWSWIACLRTWCEREKERTDDARKRRQLQVNHEALWDPPTRLEKQITFSPLFSRFLYGGPLPSPPSPFLSIGFPSPKTADLLLWGLPITGSRLYVYSLESTLIRRLGLDRLLSGIVTNHQFPMAFGQRANIVRTKSCLGYSKVDVTSLLWSLLSACWNRNSFVSLPSTVSLKRCNQLFDVAWKNVEYQTLALAPSNGDSLN